MKRELLIRIDKQLGLDQFQARILKEARGYYIYYNRPNKKTKLLKVHKHFCGQCAWGSGKFDGLKAKENSKKKSGKNGVWIGPFSNINYINVFVDENLEEIKNKLDFRCSCLKVK